jgi:hypothetical protein
MTQPRIDEIKARISEYETAMSSEPVVSGDVLKAKLEIDKFAYTDLKELLAEVERLTAENKKLREKIGHINDRSVDFMGSGPFDEKESFRRINEIYGLSKEE